MLDVVLTYVFAVAASLLTGGFIVAAGGYEADLADAPFVLFVAAQVPFWVVLVGGVVHAGERRGNGLVADFAVRMRWPDVWGGLFIGVAAQLFLVPLLYLPILWVLDDQDVSEEARRLVGRIDSPLDHLLILAMVVIIAPVVEELFFRGLALRAVERRFGMGWAVVVTSIFFGLVHFQPLQFPALVLIGLICALLVWRTGRLGPAIWTHVGFNAVTAVVLVFLDDPVVADSLTEVTKRLAEQAGGTL